MDIFGIVPLRWLCLVQVTTQRPSADFLHRQATLLLRELRGSREAADLPVQSVEDGIFAIAALIDEYAFRDPDLKPFWVQAPLQTLEFVTNNAGLEFFSRLERVRQGPRSIIATYAAALALGYLGGYSLPGADREALSRLRQELASAIGADPDRDWLEGALTPAPVDAVTAAKPLPAFWRQRWFSRSAAAVIACFGLLFLVTLVWRING